MIEMRYARHIFLTMILGALLFWQADAGAQTINDVKIDLRIDKKTLKEVLTIIQQKSGFQFVYNDKLVSVYTSISLKADDSSMAFILNEILSRTNLQYVEQNKKIIISEKDIGMIMPGNSGKVSGTLTGSVKSERGGTITGATIFLSKTKNITRSDESGKFRLNQLEPGKYEIVVKMLGFDPYVRDIFIQNDPVELSIELKEKNIALNTVVIKGGPPNPFREEYLNLFKQYFIGESFNSLDCEIVNPEVLNLHYNKRKETLEASSDAFLTINNYSLGYRINYLMGRFEFDLKNNILHYEGFPYFEEMGGSQAQLEQWALNRETTYRGSVRHFFKALFNISAEAEGFLVYPVPKKQVLKRLTRAFNEKNPIQIKPVKTDSIFNVVNENLKEWQLDHSGLVNRNTSIMNKPSKTVTNTLYIVYTRETEPMEFIVSGRHIPFPINKKLSAQSQISTIEPLLNKILIDKNGGVSPDSFLFKGYWSWENIADMLPLDYTGRPDNNIIATQLNNETK